MKTFFKLLLELAKKNTSDVISEEGGLSAGAMTTSTGIAGLGDDAREGNVVVRKKPKNILRRKKRIL